MYMQCDIFAISYSMIKQQTLFILNKTKLKF